ncbi:zf-CSL-domain-containing protein [Hysterangium stoloniferum]|nr:zf-CSL-domain-containing protein [Hysterangium stoloniferum]
MGAYYDEIEIEDMVWDEEKRVYHYPCPCGDRFEISREQLKEYEDIATCPSCSLVIRVIYDPFDYQDDEEDDEDKDDNPASDDQDEKDDEDSDTDEHFQDAFENFHISEPKSVPEQSPAITVSA